MRHEGPFVSSFGIDRQGLPEARTVYWNLSPARLCEMAVLRGEAKLASEGPLVCLTGSHTGRSPQDKFVVGGAAIDGEIWWGEVNRRFERERYEAQWRRVRQYLADRDLFVFDYAGTDPRYRLPVRVVTELAWHNLFAHNMFLRESDGSRLASFEPGMAVVDAALFQADPGRDGTRGATFILLDLARRTVLIGGARYAGEIKKSVFSVMNYLLPGQQVLPMHCSANYGATRDDVALFFGQTTLSADPGRTLIGDDEHGWSADGVFNVEGGCYVKVIRLSREGEPEIYETTRRFGTVLENVVCDEESRELDLDADTLTENTRSSYPLTQLASVDLGGCAGDPKHVVFLTCNVLGVLPPISRLTPDQAMYHFLSGYTARVAGTERGVTDSEVTFSSCFASPFLPPSRCLRPTSRRALATLPGALLADQHRLERRTLPTWQAAPGGLHPPHRARGAKRRAPRPSTNKARGAKRRVAEGERGGRGKPTAKPPELARTSVGAWGSALIGLLVIAFTAYGMIIGDHELLGKIWSLISGAVGAIMAWLGLRKA